MPSTDLPDLGVRASVVFDQHTHGPSVIGGRGETAGLRSLEDEIPAIEDAPGDLVDEIPIVSAYSLWVALYALQNPTEANIRRALDLIGMSGDCEESVDYDTLRPLPVPEPNGWRA